MPNIQKKDTLTNQNSLGYAFKHAGLIKYILQTNELVKTYPEVLKINNRKGPLDLWETHTVISENDHNMNIC